MKRAAALALTLLLGAWKMAAAMDVQSLWDDGDPARSEAIFREKLTQATGDDALSLQTQIARTYSLRSRFDEALALLDRSDPAARNWDASLSNNIGMALHEAGRYDEALQAFGDLLAARERIGNAQGIASPTG